jgi:hypothetical protein
MPACYSEQRWIAQTRRCFGTARQTSCRSLNLPAYHQSWSYGDLLNEERRHGKHAMPAEEIRFEIERRRTQWKVWGGWITAGAAIIVAIITVANWFHSK